MVMKFIVSCSLIVYLVSWGLNDYKLHIWSSHSGSKTIDQEKEFQIWGKYSFLIVLNHTIKRARTIYHFCILLAS